MKDTVYEFAIPGDHERFIQACELARNSAHNDELPSEIGRLSERRLHSVLKFYYESDQNLHEIKVGRFFADIVTGKQIIEIQTGDLGRLGKKLNVFLKDHNVTVVHPMAKNSVITRIDPETGEAISRRKSPVHADIYSAVPQLYRIRPYLSSPNLAIRLVFLSMEEYRTPNCSKRGSHKGSVRLERFPEELHYEIDLSVPEDYRIFLPKELPEAFTSADLKKLTGCRNSSVLLSVLNTVGTVERIGKRGNAYIYKMKA
ncbi:MAG: hypothetical protein E7633_08635 [Ruminococcaceae bacterium]|nr:hypothetical protein [Oscillospiraceae bacterium]